MSGPYTRRVYFSRALFHILHRVERINESVWSNTGRVPVCYVNVVCVRSDIGCCRGTALVVGRLDVVQRVAARLNLGFKVVAASWKKEDEEGAAAGDDDDDDDDDDLLRVVDMQTDPRYTTYADRLHLLMARKGVPPAKARYLMRTNTTVAAAMMVSRGDADALISGVAGKLSMVG